MPSSYQSARLPRARAAAETTSASWAAGLRAGSAPCTAPPCRTARARNSATSAVARAPPGRGTSRARRRARPTAGELVMLIGGGGKTCEVTGRVKKINVFPLFFSAIRPPPFFSFAIAFASPHIPPWPPPPASCTRTRWCRDTPARKCPTSGRPQRSSAHVPAILVQCNSALHA